MSDFRTFEQVDIAGACVVKDLIAFYFSDHDNLLNDYSSNKIPQDLYAIPRSIKSFYAQTIADQDNASTGWLTVRFLSPRQKLHFISILTAR